MVSKHESSRRSGIVALVVGLCFLILSAAAAPPPTCPIPLAKGNEWTYDATVRWTPIGGAEPKGPIHVTWHMVVLDVFTSQDSLAAVLRGFPDALAWYEPAKPPGYSVLLCQSNLVYQFKAKDERDARDRARQMQAALNPSPLAVLLSLPLVIGKEWADDLQREDHWYRWFVEGGRPRRHWVRGVDSRRLLQTWQVVYRTAPDHQIMEIAEGLGITRYVYVHHGTAASADANLVAFRPGGRGR